MSVYAVTLAQGLLRYDAPMGKQIWLAERGGNWKIYYKSCTCEKCIDHSHEVLIAWVQRDQISSIGFERPVAVEGRMLSAYERTKLVDLRDWLEKRKLPRKVDLAPLKTVIGA